MALKNLLSLILKFTLLSNGWLVGGDQCMTFYCPLFPSNVPFCSLSGTTYCIFGNWRPQFILELIWDDLISVWLDILFLAKKKRLFLRNTSKILYHLISIFPTMQVQMF